MSIRLISGAVTIVMSLLFAATSASAQSLGTFRWQLQPYCNVLTLTVTQVGGTYRLEGVDELCGGATSAAAIGVAFPRPDGSIGFGLTVVLEPGAAPLHLVASISVLSLSGTWQDQQGNAGTFAFNPVVAAGPPRPVGAASQVGWVNINSNATVRSTSSNLTGTTVQRPAANPVGVYCIRFPTGAGFQGEAATGSVQQNTGGNGVVSFITVTRTFGSLCNAVGFNVAVQTYDISGAPADRPFLVVIPRQ